MAEPRLFMFSAKGADAAGAAFREALARAPMNMTIKPTADGEQYTVTMDVDLSGVKAALELLGPGHVVVLLPNEEKT